MSLKRLWTICLLVLALNSFACSHGSKRSGLFPIFQKGKTGFIDKKGQVVITPQFDQAGNFYDELAIVKVGEKYGFIIRKANLLSIHSSMARIVSLMGWRL